MRNDTIATTTVTRSPAKTAHPMEPGVQGVFVGAGFVCKALKTVKTPYPD